MRYLAIAFHRVNSSCEKKGDPGESDGLSDWLANPGSNPSFRYCTFEMIEIHLLIARRQFPVLPNVESNQFRRMIANTCRGIDAEDAFDCQGVAGIDPIRQPGGRVCG